MDNLPFLIPLLIAFSSGLHCLGMCGGIIGAMAVNLPAHVRQQRGGVWPYLIAANLGRLSSYALAGWLASQFGHTLFASFSPQTGHLVLQVLAGVILVLSGLFISGRFPALRWMEKMGGPLWHWLEPVGRRLIAAQNWRQSFLFGAVWGWMPCSMVYVVLMWSASACSPADSALLMILFGLGTLPFTLPAGWAAHSVNRLAIFPWIKDSIAVVLVVVGVFSLYLAVKPVDEHDHHNHHLLHRFHAVTLCQDHR
ncbi:MAG: sulfite exporter TauE/SafE family protein [Magnetococcales bacterium]|nr:sulfite exporter TauE/SafE family protein [Magnetococcales bacterium]NGZ28412.1 sulfite exporter TauE/SafE family protein [Magnetococcales bacterium]